MHFLKQMYKEIIHYMAKTIGFSTCHLVLKTVNLCSACVKNLAGDINLYRTIVRNNTPHYLKPEINPRKKLTTITSCAWFTTNYTCELYHLNRILEEQCTGIDKIREK